jgi:hypothetical protein
MNTDQVYNLIQKLVVALCGYFVGKGIGDKALWEILSPAIIGLITWYVSHRWNASPTVMAALDAVSQSEASQGSKPTSGSVRLLFLLFVSSVCAAVCMVIAVGCAAIQAGQDPIVVNAERTQTIAEHTFDLVLGVDNSSRALWQSKAPAFHDFCEWLRQPQLAYLADGTPTNVQRDIAMQLNLDKVKLDYKASKVSSNAVLEAVATLESAEQQANAWLTVITNPAPVNLNPE